MSHTIIILAIIYVAWRVSVYVRYRRLMRSTQVIPQITYVAQLSDSNETK